MRLNILAGAALFTLATSLQAQTVKGKIVSDSGDAPLQNVLITLLNAKGDTVESARSDLLGEFILRTKTTGRYRIRASRLAFTPVVTDPFPLNYRTIVDVKLTLNKQAVLLSPMVVVGSRVMTGADMMSTEGFEWRKLRYTGFFADTAYIRRASFPPFTTLLKQFIPGMTVVPGFTGNEEIRLQVARSALNGGAECAPDLYKDGSLTGTLAIQHLNEMNSADFYGIEVYRRPNIPIELQRTGMDCGVIALWTKWYRRGDRRGGGAGTGF